MRSPRRRGRESYPVGHSFQSSACIGGGWAVQATEGSPAVPDGAQFSGRGESGLLFVEQPAHVFPVLHCLLGGIHSRRPFPILCLLRI